MDVTKGPHGPSGGLPPEGARAADRRSRFRARHWVRSVLGALGRLLGLGGLLAAAHPVAHAVDLPPDRAEAMFHLYDGDGMRAGGPALLVRKSLLDTVSL